MAPPASRLASIEIPQADSLRTVRKLVEAVRDAPSASVKALAIATGFSERHVRYRVATARVLGLTVSRDGVERLTRRAELLLNTEPGTVEERRMLRRAVGSCPIIKSIDPRLMSRPAIDVNAVASRIVELSGLSPSTAERRAVVLRAWHRDLREPS